MHLQSWPNSKGNNFCVKLNVAFQNKLFSGFHEQLLKWAEEYRSHGCFCLWFGSSPFIVISKAEYVEVS